MIACDEKISFNQAAAGVDWSIANEKIVWGIPSNVAAKITGITVVKTIVLPSSYADETHLNSIKYSLQKTLEYLGDKVKYSINDNIIKVTINVHKNEIVLLNNISFVVNDDLEIIINSNTKSSEVIPITVGDNYTDGEFMMHMKNYGYSCK